MLLAFTIHESAIARGAPRTSSCSMRASWKALAFPPGALLMRVSSTRIRDAKRSMGILTSGLSL
jgi:hypothetical protein